MKTFARLVIPAVFMLPAFILSSCEERTSMPEEKGLAVFSVELTSEISSAKGSDSSVAALQLLVSVEDLSGNAVITDTLIPIYTFGTAYMSESLKMSTGSFKLTKFMVVNTSGEVIYAAPMRGSPMAYLTMKPLPIPFSITPDQVTKISAEILEVKDLTPDRFGYASFGLTVIKPIEFWTYCIIDNSLSEREQPLNAPIQITSARLTVSTPAGWKYTFRLMEKPNRLIIRGGSEVYYFLIEKEGYLPVKMRVTPEQLARATETNPLVLKISAASFLRYIELQPGSESGKDAMISNLDPDKNFGDHKYFETTFLSESVLTVMRSNRSLISFNTDTLPKSAQIKKVILWLAYDIPIPFDTKYLTSAGPSAGIAWYGAVLQNISEPWDEHKVTWSNQPKTTTVNQVYIAPFIRNSNITEIDVTGLFGQANGTAIPSYGWMFRLWPTEEFPGFRFASGDYPRQAMRPKLRIYYTL